MSTTYTITRDQIITAALRKLQVIELGATPDVDTLANASLSLNLLIKAWQTQGIKLWTVQNYTLPFVAGQNSYSIGEAITKQATVGITTASPAVITYTQNGLAANTAVVFTTDGTLPTGLLPNVSYYIKSIITPDSFTVSSTVGGTEIDTTVDGTGTYTITATLPITLDQVNDKPLKVIQAWIRNIAVTPNIDTPLQLLSRQEYNILGSKASTGQVNSIYYDPRISYGTVYTYLTPDSFTATNYTLYLVGQRPLGDISLSTDIPDFPNEWMQALVWGLADELAIEYGAHVNNRTEIAMKAEKYRKMLEDWDVETSSTFFVPDQRMR